RSLRFGLNDAHGKGMAVQFNYLMDKGAIIEDNGVFSINMEKITQAITDLDHDLLTVEAQGDYAGAKKRLDELGIVRPVLRRALDKLQGIPTDIAPKFVTADELAPVAKNDAAPAPKAKHRKR